MVYNATLADLKNEYDKIKKKLSEYEQGDRVEVDSLKDKLLKE